MKNCIPIIVFLSVVAVLLFRFGATAFASDTPASDSSEAALPAITGSSEKTDAALHITISADRPAASTSLRSAPVLINVDIKRAGDPVPDGTVVVFAISSGTGTLSGATTTVNGIATVRLTSTVAGTVIVSASAGSVSAAISSSFLVQPKQAIVKVATVGEPAPGTQIGGILASVAYPVRGYAIDSNSVSPSGVVTGSTTTLASSVETLGQVILALFDVYGIRTGEFATMTFQVADGFLPDISTFAVSPSASVISAGKNATIPGIVVVIQSLMLR